MQRYLPGALPRGAQEPPKRQETPQPLVSGVELAEFVRLEHGRAGVRGFVHAIAPYVPKAFLEDLAGRVGCDVPTGRQEPQPQGKKESGGMQPEQLLSLMQGMQKGEGGGIDPSLLLRMLKKN